MTLTRRIFWILAHLFAGTTVVLLFVGIWVPDDPRLVSTIVLSLVLAVGIYLGLALTYMEEDDGV